LIIFILGDVSCFNPKLFITAGEELRLWLDELLEWQALDFLLLGVPILMSIYPVSLLLSKCMSTYSEFLLERRRDSEDDALDDKDKCPIESFDAR
jgi:hypothetical protein